MLWAKYKYKVDISHGIGSLKTDEGLHGLIQQLIISPKSEDTVWSLKVRDRDGDIVFQEKDHVGMLNDRTGLPIGKDQVENMSFSFYDLTKNEQIEVILNLREVST